MMESKLIFICSSVIFSVLVSLSSSEDSGSEFVPLIKFLEEQRSETQIQAAQEEARSKQCTPRNHNCTSNRHSCCRGKMFKDVCMCFYVEGNSTTTDEEMCTCQQPWLHETVEDITKKLSVVTKFFGDDEEQECIAKHHECTHHKENCCKGKLFKYKCNCYDIVDDEGKQLQRCACETPFHHKLAEMSMKVWNKIG